MCGPKKDKNKQQQQNVELGSPSKPTEPITMQPGRSKQLMALQSNKFISKADSSAQLNFSPHKSGANGSGGGHSSTITVFGGSTIFSSGSYSSGGGPAPVASGVSTTSVVSSSEHASMTSPLLLQKEGVPMNATRPPSADAESNSLFNKVNQASATESAAAVDVDGSQGSVPPVAKSEVVDTVPESTPRQTPSLPKESIETGESKNSTAPTTAVPRSVSRSSVDVEPNADTSTVVLARLNSERRPPVPEDAVAIAEQTTKEENESRRSFVKTMATEAWTAYQTHTWGHGELDFRKSACYGWFGRNSGYTIVASMSTLWIMGLREEFDRGRKWIESKLDFGRLTCWAEVSRTVSDYIGGLLSCYALTGDQMFLEKAKLIATIIEPAYSGLKGLPYRQFCPKTKATTGALPFLSMISAGMLEYRYLTDLTGDQRFIERTQAVRRFLAEADKPEGLYPEEVDVESGRWKSSISSLFFSGKCFYINLLGVYIQSDRQDAGSLVQYIDAMEAIKRARMVGVSRRSNLRYARDYHYGKKFTGDFMDCAGLYLGALFALGARELEMAPGEKTAEDRERIELHWTWAREITETGRIAAAKQKTGLPPSRFHFPAGKAGDGIEEPLVKGNRRYNKEFHLSGELAESYFILYRLTHDQKYRDYAWQLAQAIQEHCRNGPLEGYPGSYGTVIDVTTVPATRSLYQSVDLLSITLKYLYLIFCEDDLLPLDCWHFNATGQPLPIKGKLAAYKG